MSWVESEACGESNRPEIDHDALEEVDSIKDAQAIPSRHAHRWISTKML